MYRRADVAQCRLQAVVVRRMVDRQCEEFACRLSAFDGSGEQMRHMVGTGTGERRSDDPAVGGIGVDMGEARVASGDLGAPLVDIARAARCSHLVRQIPSLCRFEQRASSRRATSTRRRAIRPET